MSGQKVTPLWDPNSKTPQGPLRQPNTGPRQGSSAPVENVQESLENLNLSSSLNVDAAEWYPPNFKKNNTLEPVKKRTPAQDRLRKYRTVETTSNNFTEAEPEMESQLNDQEFHDPANGDFDVTIEDVEKLQDIINQVNRDPGQFDDLVGEFLHILTPHYSDVTVIANVAELIFNEALRETNFKYSAARLCGIIQGECSLFSPTLHLLCQKQLTKKTYDANLMLLLAELHAQFSLDKFYGQYVIDTLKNVLSLGDQYSVKMVCQVLKLTGFSLELSHKEAIDDVFKQLKTLKDVTPPALPSSVINLINSVAALRDSNWGQSRSSSPVLNNKHTPEIIPTEPLIDVGPIFYGPDGQELTEEEQQFLADNCAYNDSYYYDSDPDGSWDPEMDEEMQAAFQEFLQLSK